MDDINENDDSGSQAKRGRFDGKQIKLLRDSNSHRLCFHYIDCDVCLIRKLEQCTR